LVECRLSMDLRLVATCGYNSIMVRPERRVVLTGGSPVRVSAEAPGSRPQSGGEIRPAERGVKSPCNGGEQASGPQHKVNAAASSYSQPKGVGEGRAAHVTAKATDSTPDSEWVLELSGVEGGGTLGQSDAEQERPYLAAWSGKDRAYKAGRQKTRGAGRESERSIVPGKACKTTRWREGALL
jgi:hypothetical protein